MKQHGDEDGETGDRPQALFLGKLMAPVAIASAAVAFELPTLVTVPVILGDPLLGWALAVRR